MKRLLKSLCLASAITSIFAVIALAASDYNYVSPAKVEDQLNDGKKLLIVDITPPEVFEQGHIKGSIGTGAYPVKSIEELSRLNDALKTISASDAQVVIVCPKGKGGAKRTYDHLLSKGIKGERLNILEGGLEGWPYDKVPAQ